MIARKNSPSSIFSPALFPRSVPKKRVTSVLSSHLISSRFDLMRLPEGHWQSDYTTHQFVCLLVQVQRFYPTILNICFSSLFFSRAPLASRKRKKNPSTAITPQREQRNNTATAVKLSSSKRFFPTWEVSASKKRARAEQRSRKRLHRISQNLSNNSGQRPPRFQRVLLAESPKFQVPSQSSPDSMSKPA